MKIISKKIKAEKEDYYYKHLSIINNLLPTTLSNKEIQVLSLFLSEDKNLIQEDMFNTLVRKRVMKKIGISDASLSNYLRTMIGKGFLTRNNITNKITVKDFLIPEDKVQGYQIQLISE